jgi:pimeloyl-ACP methyl ester carboxylesterase
VARDVGIPGQAFPIGGGLALNFEVDEADGRDVLFLPGFADSIRVWDELRDLLRAERPALRSTFLDLKGFGLSAKPPPPSDYRICEQARLVRSFILARGLRRPVLVGHSYGSAVALMTQVLWDELGPPAPNPLAALGLFGCPAYPQPMPSFIVPLRLPLIGPATGLLPARLRAAIVLRQVIHDPARVTPERIRRHAYFYDLPGATAAMVAMARHVIPEDLDALVPRYAAIRLPVQLAWGAEDKAIPVASGRRLAREVPGARLEVLPDCGHALHEDQPDRLWQVLRGFLDTLPA